MVRRFLSTHNPRQTAYAARPSGSCSSFRARLPGQFQLNFQRVKLKPPTHELYANSFCHHRLSIVDPRQLEVSRTTSVGSLQVNSSNRRCGWLDVGSFSTANARQINSHPVNRQSSSAAHPGPQSNFTTVFVSRHGQSRCRYTQMSKRSTSYASVLPRQQTFSL